VISIGVVGQAAVKKERSSEVAAGHKPLAVSGGKASP